MALLARVAVRAVYRPSPSFVRVELGGPDLADYGQDGPSLDQRIKLIFPGRSGLPALTGDDWWSQFLALPEEEGVAMRTYTIAGTSGSGEGMHLHVDFVIHSGAEGPGSTWAISASEGDELLVLVPRAGEEYGGIEFLPPPGADRLLIAGDETALPAIAQILRGLPDSATGAAFIEVPLRDDVVALTCPGGVEVIWLGREGRPVGSLLRDAVGAHLGFDPVDLEDDDVEPEVWETPTYSSSGEATGTEVIDGRYAWVAGEAKVVTTLRRHLVNELGVPRSQVAFMGYWRIGVAMRG